MDLSCLDASNPAFPRRLLEIPDPPERLWLRGNATALATTAVAIVGSRRASPGSLDIAHRLGLELGRIGMTIVSGLARGCDGAAHRGALDAGGRTIAVLGSGVDVIYPPEHDSLAERILAHGAIVSEHQPGTPPLPHHFRLRNRLISGLAIGVVVIEANDKSGSLITAGCALAQGREVMVVPGTVITGRNRGGHRLIRDGAALVETAEDVLDVLVTAMPAPSGERERAAARASAASALLATDVSVPLDAEGVEPVLEALDGEDPLDFDQVVSRSGLTAGDVLRRLAALEMAGRIARRPGGRFVRILGKVIT